MRITVVCCAYLLLLINSASSGRVMRRMKEYVNQKPPMDDIKQGVLHQPLDHFDKHSETFPQRYFINEAYWARPDGPVFLYIGGESTMYSYVVLAGHHVDMAAEHGALVVALEHRFYGESINPDGLHLNKMRFLASQNSLVDLVAFHQYITQSYNLTHKNTWISFGGSYAGALSAWLHDKFPHLIYAAVASSAPVKAKLDFSKYNKVVGESLKNEAVGGSEKCMDAVREAFTAVEAKLLGGNQTQVGKDFNSCNPLEGPEDQIELVQNLADIFMGTVQYNRMGAPLTIEKLCTIMTNKSEVFEEAEEAYDRLVKLVKVYQNVTAEHCFQSSHKQIIQELNSTTVKPSVFGERQWLFQTCSEFGYYQTCEDASCPFSRMLTLRSQTELCPLLFGISQSSLPSIVAFTNKFYGADHPRTHRVLYVNGEIDPWHELSMLRNGTAKADRDRAIFISGTSHCADMSLTRPGDPPTLKEARREIKMHVARWLKNAAWEHP
ncbi:hypothetical protein GJAV_G00052460 [Gymnothorax javanicus]|nr:hypothetical protein GJAV_G00052460 [Gymnothorax javanicus]